MNYDNYYPSDTEDSYLYSTDDSDYQPDSDYSEEFGEDEWVDSQEFEPIIPFTDDTDANQTFEDASAMSGRAAQAMPARPPRPDRPVPPRPDRPVPPIPDRPVPPIPDRPPVRPVPPVAPRPPFRPPMPPSRPNPPMPPRPIPPRPNPPRPVPPRPIPPRPVPDWSWNWGFLLPGTIFPVSVARVRFYNTAVRGPIQIFINNRRVVSNLGFLNFTRYYNVAPGRYRITVYSGNNLNAPLVDTWMSFQSNTSTTVTVAGNGFNFWLQTSRP